MFSMPIKWDEMPLSVKNAIISLVIGWASHFAFYFGYMAEGQPERITYLQLAVGIGICYCVIAIKKVGSKALPLFQHRDGGAVCMGRSRSSLVRPGFRKTHGDSPLILLLIAISFGVSLYLLLKREYRQFFALSEKKEPEIE